MILSSLHPNNKNKEDNIISSLNNEQQNNLLIYIRKQTNTPEITYSSKPTPITGGYETKIYQFTLQNQPKNIPPHLVLRLLPPTYPTNQSTLTGTLHQHLAKQQYPIPNVHLIGNDPTILGGEFLLMDYVQGKTIFTEYNEHSPSQIANACYKLHQIDPQPLIHQYKLKGIPKTRYQGLGWREEYIENNLKWLLPALSWVKDNYPQDRSNIRICHGEFHPLNVMIEDEQICAVLDWSTFKIEDPHYDLASLRNLSYIMIPNYIPERDWKQFFDDFLDAYTRKGGFERDLYEYYVVFLALMMIVSGLRYSNAVAHPRIQEGLRNVIQKFTGITLKPNR